MKIFAQVIENPIKGEIYSVERLEEYAAFLARELKTSETPRHSQSLLPRMRDNGTQLLAAYRALTEASHRKDVLPPAAEWLTDNFHIIEDQLREIQKDLPPAYYKELPKIALGELTGYPRIYAIALALIAHTDSALEPEIIRRFVHAYQQVTPLSIGELWALAITLRLVLIENLRRLAIRIVADHEKRNLANRYVDQLFENSAHQTKFQNLVSKMVSSCGPSLTDDCAYIAQIAKRLRDQEPEIWPALESLEKYLAEKNSSTDQVVHHSHQQQAANQVTVANIITSMRLLSSLNWRELFESISRVDQILRNDPIYEKMDFLTRDRYRHVIEKVSKKTAASETEIAETLLKLASDAKVNEPDNSKRSHVGYYLIDQGFAQLGKAFHFKTAKNFELRSASKNLIYFGLLGFFLILAGALPVYQVIHWQSSPTALIGIALLILIPCSEFAVGLTNLVLTHAIDPQNLPKMDFSAGIPETAKTMVIIPCLLPNRQVIRELLEKIEIHYLCNADEQLFFALLTDFTDAPKESMPEDEMLISWARDGINQLNQKYALTSEDRFFLFHRRRLWNSSEQAWMGWERKQGKIHEFNRLLRGDQNTTFNIVTAPDSLFPSLRYVITLDADTQLPRDAARKMVGTITHPLNQPHFDKTVGRVTEGYGILQPRIGISLESSSRSYFSKIFSGYIGIDPYTTAVSDVYQDLFHEGSFTGKGLYDIDAFEAALKNRIPENTVLSHDLFEGLFARTGLLTDVELLDDYPQTYRTFFTRQHRWTRGDWQIGGWIFHRLPLISRWKIFDNLRRSLVAPATFLWLVLAWLALPGSPLFWAGYALSLILLPMVIQELGGGLAHTNGKIKAWQFLFHITFLAHQAYVQTDAIVRVVYRKLISKRKLLEWTTAAQVESQEDSHQLPLWQRSLIPEILLVGIAGLLIVTPSSHQIWGLALLALWMCYPQIAELISQRRVQKVKPLNLDEQNLMRQVARRTWHYFETFVGADDHWLPPDNFQQSPNPVIAHRTSPTNIGLYLLSLMSARDFGYISAPQFLRQLKSTLETLDQLERYQGHYLNWYDTQTLAPLNPKYVSTVDSGNLAGYLLTLRQACLELSKTVPVDNKVIEGLKDTLSIVEDQILEIGANTDYRKLLIPAPTHHFSSWYRHLTAISQAVEKTKEQVLKSKNDITNVIHWLDLGLQQITEVKNNIAALAPWVLSAGPFPAEDAIVSWSALAKSASTAQIANQLLISARTSAQFLDQKLKEMDFNFLLDKKREIFSIGYSVTDGKFDGGLYDLLGSESRLASFIAIAKGDITQEHWFRLGRQLVPSHGGRALVSWTASMFEYLMPMLVLRDYENTLLNETMQTVVERQIRYGHENNVPWGVSEAGYNARDLQLNYQYGPFGIPGLGLKRGLSQDLVISPYSTVLAAMVRPQAAVENLKRFKQQSLLTNYGFYEAIDYTRDRLPDNEKFAVIKSFMAHHQGMSLVAINNVIHNNIVQSRFHRDPRVRASRLLLQEKIPNSVSLTAPKAGEIEIEIQHQRKVHSLVRNYTDPNSPAPHLQLLSNGDYSVMISTAGGGYSKCGEKTVTRWKEDATRDHWGSFIFLRDENQKSLWSTTYQPFAELPESYQVTFGEDKVDFRRRDGDISTYTQILVAPEDNVEIRHVTLTNHSDEDRILELTSYLEPVLAPMNSDLSHLAFSKLFIQTEFLATKSALLARRRKRSADDKESWGLHVVVSDSELQQDIEYESDRAKFIGRGRSLINALALTEGKNLSNTAGTTIDPILSLRIKVKIPAHRQTQVAFTTGLASSREEALELADRYHDIHSFDRESRLAWIQSQVDMRHLNIDSQTAFLYQRLAERILYSEPSLRPPAHHRAMNTNVQSSLWPSGIGGDLPIVVVKITDSKDIAVIQKLLRCQEYLRLKGLVYDFVIINEHEATYHQQLQEDLLAQVRIAGSQGWLNKNGGIFILRRDITPAKDLAHIQSVARVSLIASEPLKEQVNRRTIEEKYPPPLVIKALEKKDSPVVEPTLNIDFFNGFGGFAENGQEYVTVLRENEWTPAPWINVVGNKHGFGFQVSEAGSGFTWSVNSQTNRLTPWSNDPVMDPPGEIIYLRDDDTGEIWTPTPLPIRSPQTYIIKHSQGATTFEHFDHGIEHSLQLFVPVNDTLKISILKIKNRSHRKRRISVTSYTEWVLGSQREKTSPYLICDIDQASGAIFAKNPHDDEFSGKVSFADISQTERTFTCSRKEFLGRNGHYAWPAALRRRGLSQKRGTGQDPCAVLQTSVELAPNEEFEISFLLGQCDSAEAARQLTLQYRDLKVAKAALDEVLQYWQNLNQRVQVKTPAPAMNMMMNHWLLYQTLSCRYWSRTAFYQSGGAYGFRDQLQDCMAFVYAAPNLAKEQILRASEHQFKEGDVQHWWHPPTGRGIRTRMSDDLLWLPFVVSFYIRVTGDHSILKEKTFFLEAPELKPEEEDSYTLPQVSTESATLLEHCLRALNHSLVLGQHGLPLIGTGDWNDGMNRIGSHGQGESIWLGWFLSRVLADFLPHCEHPEIYLAHIEKLKTALEKNGWDGDWYKRAYFDDGTPVGSAASDDCQIDSISQTWSVLSKVADPARSQRAMEKVSEFLIREKSKLILLLTPPFDKGPKDPGYIKGYVPGVRENGGQYTHAAIWVIMAYAELGDGDKAFELFNMLNPILHSQTPREVAEYKVEPYVIAADVYGVAPHEGRGGWSWYTGSASWYYRAGLESVLGFQLCGKKLKIKPCIPRSWKSYEIIYTFGKSKYFIQVQNPHSVCRGYSEIELIDDGKDHQVTVILEINQPVTVTHPAYNDQSKI